MVAEIGLYLNTGNNYKTAGQNSFESFNSPCPSVFTKSGTRQSVQQGIKTDRFDINGKIDVSFGQGTKLNDCWLLASIYSIANTPNGKKLIEDSITLLPDNKVRVTLKGVNCSYIYDRDYVKSRNDLAGGDLDVRLLEIAVENYMKEYPQRNKNHLDGNRPWVAFKILTGKGARKKDSESNITGTLSDYKIDSFNDENYIGIVWKNTNVSKTFKTSNGKSVTLEGSHTYSVAGSDSNNVYLVNPHDTSEKIAVPRNIFKNFFNRIDEFYL